MIVQKSANFKMCKLPNKQGWAIADFKNVRSLFLKSEKNVIKKFAHFCTLALLKSHLDR